MEDYQYDAFLSYSHQDVEWARQLESDLAAAHFKVFRDKTRLTAGNDWNRDLQDAIRSSRHLIVLWSEGAAASQWVTQEMTHFEIDKNDAPERRHIHVDLQGQSEVYRQYHRIEDLKTANAYVDGFSALRTSGEPWRNMLDKLQRALDKEARILVHKVVLASTLPRLQAVHPEKQIKFMPIYAEALEGMGIKKDDTTTWQAELANYYGPARNNWKPFGGVQQIDTILDGLARDIQAISGAPRFRWQDMDDAFWTVNANGRDDPETLVIVQAQIRKVLGELVLIVIDPISLYDEVVYNRLSELRTHLQNNPTATSVLAPFPIPKPTYYLRKLIETGLADLWKQFFDPVFGEDSRATALEICAMNDLDLRRLLGATLRFRKPKPETPPMLATHS
jgi:hypothetical protein